MLGILDIQDFVEADVLPEVAGGLKGCAGGLINSIPTEMDCNAAASVYVMSRFAEDEIQALRDGSRRNLVCSLIPPPPVATLPARMIAFAFIHGSAVERCAERRGFSVEAILSTLPPEALAIWARLVKGK
jgi:hypothetical protein